METQPPDAQSSRARLRVDADKALEMMIEAIIGAIGDDPTREGVLDTPARVVKSWKELYAGYNEDPAKHLEKRFPLETSQMVTLADIEFFSTCEHHMLPFMGRVDVAYIPQTEVCGLSKIARVVHGYARRLQMQERIGEQVANAFEEQLKPLGVAVRIRSTHMCMQARGVQASGAHMVTTCLRGKFLEDPSVKAEWLASLPK